MVLKGTKSSLLSLLRHSNLVTLTGYCADGDQRLLVYAYMPLGSLEHHLFDLEPDKEPLDWHNRLKIAVGATHGLEYLHCKANPPIIYWIMTSIQSFPTLDWLNWARLAITLMCQLVLWVHMVIVLLNMQ